MALDASQIDALFGHLMSIYNSVSKSSWLKKIDSISHNALDTVRQIVKKQGLNKDKLLKRLGLTLLGDKSLDQEEFIDCLKELDEQLSDAELKDMFIKLSKNGQLPIVKLIDNLTSRGTVDLVKDV